VAERVRAGDIVLTLRGELGSLPLPARLKNG
jgi:hypothetical protein